MEKEIPRITIGRLVANRMLESGPIEDRYIVTDKGKDCFMLIPMNYFTDQRKEP